MKGLEDIIKCAHCEVLGRDTIATDIFVFYGDKVPVCKSCLEEANKVVEEFKDFENIDLESWNLDEER